MCFYVSFLCVDVYGVQGNFFHGTFRAVGGDCALSRSPERCVCWVQSQSIGGREKRPCVIVSETDLRD